MSSVIGILNRLRIKHPFIFPQLKINSSPNLDLVLGKILHFMLYHAYFPGGFSKTSLKTNGRGRSTKVFEKYVYLEKAIFI